MRRIQKNIFFKVCPRTVILIPFFCFFFCLQTVCGAQLLVPSGRVVGVTMDTKGLLVLGVSGVAEENGSCSTPCKGILQEGDLLLQADGRELENKEVFMETIENSGGRSISLLLERNGREKEVSVRPVFSAADGTFKIGAWIRDSIQGIGTVTYYDPATGRFGALGHGVYDVDTDALMQIRTGALTEVELTEIIRGQNGKAGELTGKIDLKQKFACVEKNTESGIFGMADAESIMGKAIPAAPAGEVKKGEAFLLSDLEGSGTKAYAVEIESICKNRKKQQKDMMIRITDKRLLNLTGGIVQGISGSPILQDGRLVGAVTHVLINDPSRGYGILIENMLYAAE